VVTLKTVTQRPEQHWSLDEQKPFDGMQQLPPEQPNPYDFEQQATLPSDGHTS
jgi:hypothetical protein